MKRVFRKGSLEFAQAHNEQNVLTAGQTVVASPSALKDSQAIPDEEAIQPVSTSFLYLFWQMTANILFGLLGLIVLLALFPFLALFICLDSPGPIFYHQDRVGYRGRTFLMHKFRSMRASTGTGELLLWGSAASRRVTRIGRFLRATHIDELPQVVNILRGEMNLIGPRPEQPVYVAELEKSNPRYRYRSSVKPGLTGWAQVNYGYGHSYEDDLIKLQYDLFYIENRSFKLDLLIIARTVIEVIRHRGDK